MQAGNHIYSSKADIPEIVPIFPLEDTLLLPGGLLPLNIFEKRYLAMIDDAIHGDRLIGMVQPSESGDTRHSSLRQIGCLGRVTAFQEAGDNTVLIGLYGICRFKIINEEAERNGYRNCKIEIFVEDLDEDNQSATIDRETLITTFKNYLEANAMEADWESIDSTDDQTLVTALCMMSPYGSAEKQALLEAPDLKSRAETLIALTEIDLARNSDNSRGTLQ
ncbi:MAG: LON peptidase substrate-binding domain-containing protein [Rhizobiaceae bacterium]|nr:LON peptidase substrate-binding domain-containing protein [Rhizobiaceae bacterium]